MSDNFTLAPRHETERGDHEFRLSRSHYTDTIRFWKQKKRDRRADCDLKNIVLWVLHKLMSFSLYNSMHAVFMIVLKSIFRSISSTWKLKNVTMIVIFKASFELSITSIALK